MSHPKDDVMTSVVMKFGGTSVKDPARLRAVARHISQRTRHGSRIVAVVSAMGATTDSLLGLAGELSDRPQPRELDLLMATGECAAASLLCYRPRGHGRPGPLLHRRGRRYRHVGGLRSRADPGIDPEALTRALDAGIVPVIAGFQGSRPDGEVTTLGRGGSDTTAVAIAASLGVACEIYTDVDGVLASDPRMVPDAEPRRLLSHQALSGMSANGAAVVSRRAVELATVHNVQLQVRSSFSWQPGTVVGPGAAALESPTVVAVSADQSAAVLGIEGIGAGPAAVADVLDELGRAEVPVIMVPGAAAGPRAGLAVLISGDDVQAAIEVLGPIARSRDGRVTCDTSHAVVGVTGVGLTSHPGGDRDHRPDHRPDQPTFPPACGGPVVDELVGAGRHHPRRRSSAVRQSQSTVGTPPSHPGPAGRRTGRGNVTPSEHPPPNCPHSTAGLTGPP